MKLLQDVPTLKGAGLPFVFALPLGVACQKGRDPKVAAKIHDAFQKTLANPSLLAAFEMVPNHLNSADFRKR